MAVVIAVEILEKIIIQVQEILETREHITLDQNFESMDLNSLKSIALIGKLEESFDIFFEDDELLFEYFNTIQKIAQRVASKLQQ